MTPARQDTPTGVGHTAVDMASALRHELDDPFGIGGIGGKRLREAALIEWFRRYALHRYPSSFRDSTALLMRSERDFRFSSVGNVSAVRRAQSMFRTYFARLYSRVLM